LKLSESDYGHGQLQKHKLMKKVFVLLHEELQVSDCHFTAVHHSFLLFVHSNTLVISSGYQAKN
jgi:hypothetical protein